MNGTEVYINPRAERERLQALALPEASHAFRTIRATVTVPRRSCRGGSWCRDCDANVGDGVQRANHVNAGHDCGE